MSKVVFIYAITSDDANVTDDDWPADFSSAQKKKLIDYGCYIGYSLKEDVQLDDFRGDYFYAMEDAMQEGVAINPRFQIFTRYGYDHCQIVRMGLFSFDSVSELTNHLDELRKEYNSYAPNDDTDTALLHMVQGFADSDSEYDSDILLEWHSGPECESEWD